MGRHSELDSIAVAVQRVGRQRRLSGAVLALGIAAWPAGILTEGSGVDAAQVVLAGMALLLPALGAGLLGYAGRDHGSRRGSAGRIRVRAAALEVTRDAKRWRFALDAVQGGWIEESEGEPTAVLHLEDDVFVSARFRATERELAERLLQQAGVNAKAVALRLDASERGDRGSAAGCLVLLGMVAVPLFMVLGILVHDIVVGRTNRYTVYMLLFFGALGIGLLTRGWFLLQQLMSTTVAIGSDGLRIVRLGRARFLPYPELEAVSYEGSRLLFRSDSRTLTAPCSKEAADAVLKRIERARAASLGTGRWDLTALARQDRTARDWQAAIRARLTGSARYRQAPLERAALIDIAADPEIAIEHRVGAAIAMSPDASPSERERLRAIAAQCAEPDLRAVFEGAAEGRMDEAAVGRALKVGSP